MKTKLLFIFSALLISALLFSFCRSNDQKQQNSSVSAQTEMDTTGFDKYVGLYVFGNNYGYYSIGKFPANSIVHTENGDKYPPLDGKFIGKFFLVNDNISYMTNRVAPFAGGGYIAPGVGDIIIGVDASGAIHTQHYTNYGRSGDVMDFNLQAPHVYGKFILRSDGKYDLSINNALYVWTKGE